MTIKHYHVMQILQYFIMHDHRTAGTSGVYSLLNSLSGAHKNEEFKNISGLSECTV